MPDLGPSLGLSLFRRRRGGGAGPVLPASWQITAAEASASVTLSPPAPPAPVITPGDGEAFVE